MVLMTMIRKQGGFQKTGGTLLLRYYDFFNKTLVRPQWRRKILPLLAVMMEE
jgi:hypothetical protein